MITVGYGDICPVTQLEMVISILTMLFACGVYAYSLNAIGSIFEELNSGSKLNKQNLYVINHYMDQKKISFKLRYEIREYLEYYWKESLSNNG